MELTYGFLAAVGIACALLVALFVVGVLGFCFITVIAYLWSKISEKEWVQACGTIVTIFCVALLGCVIADLCIDYCKDKPQEVNIQSENK